MQSTDTPSNANRILALERQIESSLAALDSPAPLMELMVRYSLGLVNAQGEATDDETRQQVQGKRIRPLISMIVADAVSGSFEAAVPVATAIELLHNFTLIHDDIQDRSPNRRHRPTVWRIWGDAQAINAGDALFAVSQLSMLDTTPFVDASTLRTLLAEFNRCTLEIVRGQVQDVGNEGRLDVTPADYLEMIGGKTAEILRFSAWAGATAAGADPQTASRLGDMAQAIGMGFQIRDDMLGIWGPAEITGKDAADDLRRRKQSLPVLILRDAANDDDAARIAEIYGQESITEDSVAELIDLLTRYDVQSITEDRAKAEHTRALEILNEVFGDDDAPAIQELRALIEQLTNRTF